MPRVITSNTEAIAGGVEFQYLCENIKNIKENKGNPSECNASLKSIGSILSRCYGIKISTTILDTDSDTNFFGINIYPDFKPIRDIIDIACDGELDKIKTDVNTPETPSAAIKYTWSNINEWHFDFDSKMFYSLSHPFTPKEIACMLLYEIERIIFSYDIPMTVYKSIKHVFLNVNYHTQCISKSTLCRNFYIIPFAQACGFVNFISELPEESILQKNGDLYSCYLGVLTKLTTEYSSSIINRPSFELRDQISYILSWVIEAINDLKYNMYILKKSIQEQIVAEKSYYIKNLLTSIINQFSSTDVSSSLFESYLPQNEERLKMKFDMKMSEIKGIFDRIVTEADVSLLDRYGRVKSISQEDIDILRLEVQKIKTIDDKIYYMEELYNKLNLVNYSLELLNNPKTKDRVKEPLQKLKDKKEQLEHLRQIIISMRINEKRYGLFIEYPPNYAQ